MSIKLGTGQLESDAKLISIGLVSADGQELYAEVKDTFDPLKCSPFVIESVLPLLEGGSCRITLAELARKLKAWIESIGSEAVLVSDLPAIDWPFIYDLFEAYGWPSNLQKRAEPVSMWIPKDQSENFKRACEDFWLDHGGKQHHALEDARSLFEASSKCAGIEVNSTPHCAL